jgi:hypothetical protein
MKECTKCNVKKSLTEFYTSKKIKSGYISTCKLCESKRKKKSYSPEKNNTRYLKNKDMYLTQQKVYYNKNKEVIRKQAKNYYSKNKSKWFEAGWKAKGIYNRDGEYFTLENYNEELNRTNNKCEICFSDGSNHKKKLCVDHNHDTGIVRGILCGHCNVGIGMFHDNPDKLKKAIQYLK